MNITKEQAKLIGCGFLLAFAVALLIHAEIDHHNWHVVEYCMTHSCGRVDLW